VSRREDETTSIRVLPPEDRSRENGGGLNRPVALVPGGPRLQKRPRRRKEVLDAPKLLVTEHRLGRRRIGAGAKGPLPGGEAERLRSVGKPGPETARPSVRLIGSAKAVELPTHLETTFQMLVRLSRWILAISPSFRRGKGGQATPGTRRAPTSPAAARHYFPIAKSSGIRPLMNVPPPKRDAFHSPPT